MFEVYGEKLFMRITSHALCLDSLHPKTVVSGAIISLRDPDRCARLIRTLSGSEWRNVPHPDRLYATANQGVLRKELSRP